MQRSSRPTASSASSCFSARSGIGYYEEGEWGKGKGEGEGVSRAPTDPPYSPCPIPEAAAGAPKALPHAESSRPLMGKLPVILAITGASGAAYGVRLLEVLATHQAPTWLMISAHGWRLLSEECRSEERRVGKECRS